MARPLKYGEKTSVRSITIPDTMWENLPHPKSQWVVEAVRQMLENPRPPVVGWAEGTTFTRMPDGRIVGHPKEGA